MKRCPSTRLLVSLCPTLTHRRVRCCNVGEGRDRRVRHAEGPAHSSDPQHTVAAAVARRNHHRVQNTFLPNTFTSLRPVILLPGRVTQFSSSPERLLDLIFGVDVARRHAAPRTAHRGTPEATSCLPAVPRCGLPGLAAPKYLPPRAALFIVTTKPDDLLVCGKCKQRKK